ncbi:maltokinase N-terminal cap-like domain-containing protein [Subtercola lobariae]|uniref:Maltokinase N-terminal cap domain-containing protein n=1 Tax=Subtercola lobariae TaxID=1588641 RepID=A0A917B5F9_9MICO|nr:hypothetical protein [Subtercola lobariae]GGF21975.1 hypothetical protein GCM10011399_14600 [Subtercola lobariae]
MALIYRADLQPSKLDLLRGWLPRQPWYAPDTASAGKGSTSTGSTSTPPTQTQLSTVGSFRFDDPAGEVGVETLFVQVDEGVIHQVPLTYRGAPLVGAEASLIGITEHSVLGTRWVYDGLGDPVFLAVTVNAALNGGRHADEFVDVDGELILREPRALVRGSGTDSGAGSRTISPPAVAEISTTSSAHDSTTSFAAFDVVVFRTPEPAPRASGSPTQATPPQAGQPDNRPTNAVLTATWAGQPVEHTLVRVTTAKNL